MLPGVIHRQAGESRAAQRVRRRNAGPARRDHVLNQKELIDRLFAVLDGLSNAAFAVALVQAVGAILLIANMVQVAAYTRRTEVGIMRLVGATRWYTQLPFLVEAMVAATVGVIIAIVGLIVVRALFLDNALEPVLPSASDRPGRLRRHPLHLAAAAVGGRRDGRGHLVRNVASIRAAVAVAKKAARQISASNGRSWRPTARRDTTIRSWTCSRPE